MPQTAEFIHGTTLAVNAIIERNGARTALITTRGFRDVLEIRRATRAHLFDMMGDPPEPLVPRHWRYEVNERIWHDGRIIEPLGVEQLDDVISSLKNEGIESVAVIFLHAYQFPEHERMVADAFGAKAADIYVSLSSEVLPVIHEYERSSSTAVNAYVKPLISAYLSQLHTSLTQEGFSGNTFVMLSGGGITSAETAAAFPVRIIESGPVGGVIAADYFASQLGYDSVLAFDMGGTTAKSSLITEGEIPITSDYEVDRTHRFMPGSGLPLGVPSVDVIEIGAGGGSIAYVDLLGLLKVGPESAGAKPGPACYGNGGTQPTVSDANLVLGYLDAEYFLGGEMPLDVAAAQTAIEEYVAEPLGIDLVSAAWGIHNLVNENMSTTLRLHAAQRGGKLSQAVLMAYGGAGPLHCYHLAEKLGIETIIVPPSAGVVSALGFLSAPLSYEVAATYKKPLRRAELEVINARLREMEERCLRTLETAEAVNEITWRRWIEMCYRGQGYEIRLPIENGDLDSSKTVLQKRFQDAYRRRYGYAYDDVEIEITGLRVVATGPVSSRSKQLDFEPGNGNEAFIGRRLAFDPERHDYVEYPVYDRYRLAVGDHIEGPAIVQERESTLVVSGKAKIDVGMQNTLVVTLQSTR